MKESMNQSKVTLWTSQSKIVLDTIEEKGIYHVKKDFIIKKYEEIASIFLEVYDWYSYNAQRLVPKPLEAEYPIWAFTDPTYVDHHPDHYLLKLSVEADKVILFDREKWNNILNLSYIPKDSEDNKNYEKTLKNYGIKDETEVYLKNYYPHLKAKVRKSWDRLFDKEVMSRNHTQVSLWEIRREWVIK